MRAVHGSTVLYPCDGNQTARLVAQMADRQGITYLRTTREKTPVIYGPGEDFEIGWCKVVRWSEKDRVTIVAAGITVHEAIKAYDVLATQQIPVRVIDLYTVKPIDADALANSAKATGGRIVVVEDHWVEGGIGDAVLAALADKGVRDVQYRHLAVRKMPGSGKPAEMLDDAGISTVHIVRAVKALLG
jgi:transketolase